MEVGKWKRIWRDLKARTKKKLGEIKTNLRATGGGPSKCVSLTLLEENVARLLQIEKSAVPTGPFYGYRGEALRRESDEKKQTEEKTLGADIENDLDFLLGEPEADEAGPDEENVGPPPQKKKRTKQTTTGFQNQHLSLLQREMTNHTKLLDTLDRMAGSLKEATTALQAIPAVLEKGVETQQEIGCTQKTLAAIIAQMLSLHHKREDDVRRDAVEALLQLNRQ